jgi:muramoyltetrapeptide carboxypeptidase
LYSTRSASRRTGHFAGDDQTRAEAFLEVANDKSYDAVWFARGGYGSYRVVETIMPRLRPPSRGKAYLGYSDAGMLLAALYRAGFTAVAHGPVAQDIRRDGGDKAVARSNRRSTARKRPRHST